MIQKIKKKIFTKKDVEIKEIKRKKTKLEIVGITFALILALIQIIVIFV
jgi:hypothetical protein